MAAVAALATSSHVQCVNVAPKPLARSVATLPLSMHASRQTVVTLSAHVQVSRSLVNKAPFDDYFHVSEKPFRVIRISWLSALRLGAHYPAWAYCPPRHCPRRGEPWPGRPSRSSCSESSGWSRRSAAAHPRLAVTAVLLPNTLYCSSNNKILIALVAET